MEKLTGTNNPQKLSRDLYFDGSAYAQTLLLTCEGGSLRFAYNEADLLAGKAHILYAGDALRLNSLAQIKSFCFANANPAEVAEIVVSTYW